MSPANVYRFFDSKKAINEGVARRLMGGVEDAAQAIATRHESAVSRLRELVTTVHRMNFERYVGDSKLHEMVEIAMEGSWGGCLPHMQRITETIAAVIADGAASGEFEAPDVPLAAMCACTAMMRFFHPQMIAQCAIICGWKNRIIAVQAHIADRKSTRLNSSHANISYAVFCLNKTTT